MNMRKKVILLLMIVVLVVVSIAVGIFFYSEITLQSSLVFLLVLLRQ